MCGLNLALTAALCAADAPRNRTWNPLWMPKLAHTPPPCSRSRVAGRDWKFFQPIVRLLRSTLCKSLRGGSILQGTGCVESQSVSVFPRCEFGWLVRISRFLWRRIPNVGVWATVRRRPAVDLFRTAYHARMWAARQCPMRGVIKTGLSGMEACLLSARRTGSARVAMLITPCQGPAPMNPCVGASDGERCSSRP